MDEQMTLGQRFRRHVAEWVMEGDDVPFPDPRELGRLERYADVCERLARAADAKEKCAPAVLVRRVDYGDTTNLVYDANPAYWLGEDYDAALAAYRAEVGRG